MFGRRDEPEFNALPLLTFLIGVLAGAAVALLYAPTSGKRLKRQLRDALDDKVEDVQDAVRKIVRQREE